MTRRRSQAIALGALGLLALHDIDESFLRPRVGTSARCWPTERSSAKPGANKWMREAETSRAC